MPQTRVTASSGRMSRRNAYDALATIKAVAGTFPTMGTAQRMIRQAQALQDALYTDDLAPGVLPAKATLLQMQNCLNVLVADRLARSERATPDVHQAVTVCLYGTEANDTTRAFQIAAQDLSCPPEGLSLVDVTPVQTDALSGSRWTIRVKMPHETAPSAPQPDETPVPGTTDAPDLLQALSDALSAAKTAREKR